MTNFISIYGSSTLQPSRKTTAPEHSSINADGGTSLEGGISSRGILERGHLLSTNSQNSLKRTSAENPGPGGVSAQRNTQASFSVSWPVGNKEYTFS